jgi:hypothetical protein
MMWKKALNVMSREIWYNVNGGRNRLITAIIITIIVAVACADMNLALILRSALVAEDAGEVGSPQRNDVR